jgi:hypothetical protein
MQLQNWTAVKTGIFSRVAIAGTALMLAATGLSAAASADTTPPKRIRGTIDTITDTSLDMTSRGGQKMSFKLAPDLKVTGVTRTTLSDIKPGSFIGTAAMPQADGSLKALEVHIFPDSMKGTGEGMHPWDQGKSSKMLNGLVGSVVGTDGHSFMVKYGDQQQKVEVPDNVPIVAMEPADKSALHPGAKVIVFADPKDPQTVARVVVGEKGITPPM